MEPRRRRARRRGILAGAAAVARRAGTSLFRRPLPQTRGDLHVPGIEAEVRIGRDALGVPRIVARSRTDLAFGQGFCIGQDRLFQLEFFRRAAAGRVSEFAGRGGRAGRPPDAHARPAPRRRARGRGRSTRGSAELLDAYARGVNAAIAAAGALPLELQLLRIEPEPWTPADSLAIGKLIALGFSTNMEAGALPRRPDRARRRGEGRAARAALPAGLAGRHRSRRARGRATRSA